MTFKDPRKVLAQHGLRPKKSFSQNFLCSPHAVDAIAAAAVDGGPSLIETVVELGPGCGTLTAALLAQGVRVVAFEHDRDMLALLEREFTTDALQVRAGDAATLKYRELAAELGAPVAVVGNLPYAITGAILRRLIEDYSALKHAVIMIQREVADRLVAPAGSSSYGALSVFSHNVFAVERVIKVPKTAFHPPPKVDSAVVKLTPRPQPLTPPDRAFAAVVHGAFQARRKTLRNALRQVPGLSDAIVASATTATGIDPGLRGERLTVSDFGRLTAALSAAGGTPGEATEQAR